MKKLCILILIICWFAGVAAQQQQVQPYDALIRSVKIYLYVQKNKDYAKAEELLKTAIANYPDALEAHFNLGNIYNDQAKYKEMMEQYDKFEEICAKAAENKDTKLQKRCEKDKMAEQINDIKVSALKKNFDDGVVKLKYVDSLSHASGATPDDSTAKVIGAVLDEADKAFQDCAIIDDTVSIVWTNLGAVEKQRGNLQKATEYYQKSYKLNPKDKDLLLVMAQATFNSKDYASAAKYYGEFAEQDTANRETAWLNEAMCYQSLKDDEKLKATLDKIISVNPTNTDVLFQRGYYYIRKATSKLMQDSAHVLDSLGEAHPDRKSIDKAKQDLMASRLEFYKLALPDFKVAAETAKTDPEYWYWYGSSALLSDKLEESRHAYEKCIEVKSDHKDCWCQLQTVYAKMRLNEEFEKAQKKCESIQ